MRLASLISRVRDWRERRAAVTEIRRLNRLDAPFRMVENKAMVEAITLAASCGDTEGTLAGYHKLRVRAPNVAITSEAVIQALFLVGEVNFVESVVEEGLRKYPSAPQLVRMHGVIAHHRRDWPEMANRFAVMRRKFPDEVWGYILGGVAVRELGQFDEADKLLARAVSMDRTFFPSACEYARVAEHRGDHGEALRRWEYTRDRFEENWVAWVEQARVLHKIGQDEAAIALLNAARWRFQNKAEPMIALARIAHSRGQWEDAARQWEAIREQFSHEKAGYTEGAQSLRDLGRREEAKAVLKTYADRLSAQATNLDGGTAAKQNADLDDQCDGRSRHA